MRTSSQLNRTGACERNAHSDITTTSRHQTLASVQRQVALRILKGERIPDIAGEIDSVLASKGFLWENLEQRYANIDIYAARIEKITDYLKDENLIFPDAEEMNTEVDYFGETVKALPDFFIDRGDHVEACRLSTSRGNSVRNDINNPSLYAVGLAGKKLFPGKQAYACLFHLAPPSAAEENFLLRNPDGSFRYVYNERGENMISTLHMDSDAKEVFKAMYEEEQSSPKTCSAEDCAGCPQQNICNFEEAPIVVSMEQVAIDRDWSGVRLTSSQAAVRDFDRGIARVDAGPGGGKTLVLAMRIAALREKGVEPEEMCLLTYTKAGAEEMTARAMSVAASKGVPLDPEKFTAGTFHSFCQSIINEDGHYQALGYSAPPRIVPEAKRLRIINDLLGSFPKVEGWKYQEYSDSQQFNNRYTKSALKRAQVAFEAIKKEGATRDNPFVGDCVQKLSGYSVEALDVIFAMYEEFNARLKAQNLCEYDDLISGVKKLAGRFPNLFDEMGYKHILVDEFQDTDLPQIEILQKMIDTSCFESFMAVGDDSQSIFGFRHTSPEFLINFEQYFGRFEDFKLTENHRSDKLIVDFANALNDRSLVKVDKDLIPTKLPENKPDVMGCYSKKDEMTKIAEEVAARWEAGERDIAVLMSTRAELNAMASALTKKGIPSVLMCNVPYVKNSRVSALATFYDSFCGKSTQGFVDYENVLKGGALRGADAEQLSSVVEDMKEKVTGGGFSKFMEFAEALDSTQADACYQSFLEQVKFCRDTDELSEFWEDFRIYGGASEFKREGKYEGVSLNTIHSSKGLEWDTTYLSLTSLDSIGAHSNARAFVNSGEHDETIRKFFVGATRARKNLIMTGEYVLKMDKYGAVFNDYVRMAYEILGKPMDYSYTKYHSVNAAEKQAEKEAAKMAISPRNFAAMDPKVRAAVAVANTARSKIAAAGAALQEAVLESSADALELG